MAIHVTFGRGSKVHLAWVASIAEEGLAETLYETACGLYARRLGGRMRQTDEPVTCQRCQRYAQ